jgi:uncharacterized membrane protein
MAATPHRRLQPAPGAGDALGTGSVEEVTRQNVERVLALEAAEHEKATITDRIAKAITGFCGSITFVLINAVAIGTWIGLNVALPEPRRFDPFPFSLLTLAMSIEAIFLATFILINQNRAARVSEKRSHLGLQLNLLTEQENTKMLAMLEQIGFAVGAEIGKDPDVRALAQDTHPEALSEQIDAAADEKESESEARPEVP